MKYGMNLFLWTDDPTQERLLPLYERLAGMGFDGLELPIFDATPEAFEVLGKRLSEMGLDCTAVTVRGPDDDPISSDPNVREAAGAALRRAVDCCEAAGARLLGGPLYAAIGVFSGSSPSSEEWQRSVAVLQQAADYAARADVTLAFEFLNRFEIYLLNTAEDTARYVRDVRRDNCVVHYDTFHAHIEEKDPAAALAAVGSGVGHVHISESDRSTPGRGQVRWDQTFDALQAIGYDGWLTIEAFGALLPGLAAATKIWRRMFEDEETLAREGLAFMKQQWERRASG